MAKGQVKLLWLLLILAIVILLAGCYGGSSRTPDQVISTSGAEVGGGRADNPASTNQSGAASEQSRGSSKIVKFTVPTIT